jgi:hypothetical protein
VPSIAKKMVPSNERIYNFAYTDLQVLAQLPLPNYPSMRLGAASLRSCHTFVERQ